MKIAIITGNKFFGQSLKSLLTNHRFEDEKSIDIEDSNFESIDDLDVIISDYKMKRLSTILKKREIGINKIEAIEKILITDSNSHLPPKNSIYLEKPFGFFELVGVLQPMFKKFENIELKNKNFGYLSFFISERQLIYKNSQPIELTQKECDIILFLFKAERKGISKGEIMSGAWKLNEKMESHAFETHLYRLRKKIKKYFFLDDIIVSKRGRYYINMQLIGKN